MALLERIIAMQQSGMSDAQIISTLREEGISPMEISESLSQSKIKAAVSLPSAAPGFEGMEPSIMAPVEETKTAMPALAPVSAPPTPQVAPEAAAYPPEAYYAPEAYAAPEAAAYPPEAYYAQALDVETVRDIARQEIGEELKKIRAQIDLLEKMRTEIRFELQNIENRLVKVESVIQEIQSSIIRKMGEYGEAISGISSEIKATQQSFSKMLGPLMEKRKIEFEAGESKESREKPKPKKAEEKSKRETLVPTASFEDYLR